jgi:hypothetical protein
MFWMKTFTIKKIKHSLNNFIGLFHFMMDSAELGKLFFAARDYSFVGVLSIVFLVNIFSTVWYQARRYQQNRNLYSMFSSHFFLMISLLSFEFLLMVRTTLFQSITFFEHLQPFFNASPFVLGFFNLF